jgi:lipid-A-disaccharide synthase
MLQAVSDLSDDYQIVIAGAPSIEPEYYQQFLTNEGTKAGLFFGQTYELLSRAHAAIVTSGTATLETALLGTPQVVCYHMSGGWFIKVLRKLFLKVKYISLVNLICDKEAVRELVGSEMNVFRAEDELRKILPGGSKREDMLRDYKMLWERTGASGASDRAAHEIIRALES